MIAEPSSRSAENVGDFLDDYAGELTRDRRKSSASHQFIVSLAQADDPDVVEALFARTEAFDPDRREAAYFVLGSMIREASGASVARGYLRQVGELAKGPAIGPFATEVVLGQSNAARAMLEGLPYLRRPEFKAAAEGWVLRCLDDPHPSDPVRIDLTAASAHAALKMFSGFHSAKQEVIDRLFDLVLLSEHAVIRESAAYTLNQWFADKPFLYKRALSVAREPEVSAEVKLRLLGVSDLATYWEQLAVETDRTRRLSRKNAEQLGLLAADIYVQLLNDDNPVLVKAILLNAYSLILLYNPPSAPLVRALGRSLRHPDPVVSGHSARLYRSLLKVSPSWETRIPLPPGFSPSARPKFLARCQKLLSTRRAKARRWFWSLHPYGVLGG